LGQSTKRGESQLGPKKVVEGVARSDRSGDCVANARASNDERRPAAGGIEKIGLLEIN